MGLCEVRWTGAGRIVSDRYNIIYSGGDKHERGVAVIMDMPTSKTLKGYLTISDRVMLVRLKGSPFDTTIIQAYAPISESTEDEIEKFYDEINQAKTHCKSQDIVIVMGDFNAKVGAIRHEDIVGPYGLGNRNERGEKLLKWAILNDMIIGNTCYEQPPRRLWTWKSPGDSARNQIDYIMIKKRYKNGMLNVKTRPEKLPSSDNFLVTLVYRVLGHTNKHGGGKGEMSAEIFQLSHKQRRSVQDEVDETLLLSCKMKMSEKPELLERRRYASVMMRDVFNNEHKLDGQDVEHQVRKLMGREPGAVKAVLGMFMAQVMTESEAKFDEPTCRELKNIVPESLAGYIQEH
ncbi:craniofacial development protein 2 [Aplysia californica]|uniref:Craniofacial development protein 2 n=1 Tax=Aplysia californica TaxID=6500 RepID=A0ABM1A127_APLCA|nr:craniofacial development protein 2 [Aplysia californica]